MLPVSGAYGFARYYVYDTVLALPYITLDFGLIIESFKAFSDFANFMIVAIGMGIAIALGAFWNKNEKRLKYILMNK